MSCLTCHDPHRDDQGPAAFYEGKCLSCHAGQGGPDKKAVAPPNRDSKKGSVCPVNPAAKCLDCHMPKVPRPTLHRALTDHYIRVRDRGEKN